MHKLFYQQIFQRSSLTEGLFVMPGFTCSVSADTVPAFFTDCLLSYVRHLLNFRNHSTGFRGHSSTVNVTTRMPPFRGLCRAVPQTCLRHSRQAVMFSVSSNMAYASRSLARAWALTHLRILPRRAFSPRQGYPAVLYPMHTSLPLWDV